jgi:uncharacterized protein YndB with AHSA1/START domain
MSNDRFVYVIYIRTTPETLWDAITKPEFTRKYWVGCWHDCDWKAGSPWKLMIPDGRVGDSGEVLEIDRPRRLVLAWRNEFMPDMREDGYSRATFELEAVSDAVQLTVTQESDKPKSKLIEGVATGWPVILGSLKSFLETGDALEATKHWPKGL